jgi:hypothetical protein
VVVVVVMVVVSQAHFGEWYSHPEMGECKDGAFVGDGSGCSWRAIGIDKAINASCLCASGHVTSRLSLYFSVYTSITLSLLRTDPTRVADCLCGALSDALSLSVVADRRR